MRSDIFLAFDCDGAGLRRLWLFSNSVRDIGADAGDGDDGVDVFLSCGELELDGGRGDDFGDEEGASPFVVQLLHRAV